ncbi:hypothetical protein H2201_003397 [Coniosporium apollinis]|uniref:Acyl-protein thioesterase 1 n=2 Tax=Coniosporium TaxID=2810619 RepID=A0ABQ9NYS4_9PEZI|nr:hypothetical protein H2199_002164 [Cladosporium sp. JES 115]KAJ9666475.1 hypothetical protein H2201_003397 [Coniosporium apollinis]
MAHFRHGNNPPIFKPAQSPPSDPAHSAACIFLHGLGDDAAGWATIANQFQSANKLPYMQWVFPNAPENQDAMQSAWYTPTRLSPFPSSRPELDDSEDEEGMMKSVRYVESLLDDLTSKGVPPNRIVLAGFSQGHAMSLLTGLVSAKYAGKLAGLVGLSGYLPLAERIQQLRAEAELPAVVGDVPIFLVRGMKDMLVPKRYFRINREKLQELGVKDEAVEVHEYEGLAHNTSGEEIRGLCAWLEKVVPPLE